MRKTPYDLQDGLAFLRFAFSCLFLCAVSGGTPGRAESTPVRVSEESIVIPTYLAGEPEPNPMFFFGRASQGAQGRVYPYPLYDSLTSARTNKTYKIVYLENEYVRIGVLPEIGGRLFEAVDKSNGYDFIYRQHVIKPALIGLIGAWISGGIEWNIPHHHRATTFVPVQYEISEDADGSKTIWVGELELRQRMRWAVGYTLHPGKSYLECSVRIVNRTPVVQTMLCFANVAVHASDRYQVIFPPRTEFVTHHHKREFTTWPIATTLYGGYDFSQGVDVSWYTNHISANSMFAWNYTDDFFAGYDHKKEAGIMSVADHHVVPGKKLWTWGNGPRGRMWDKILTDDDGPYIELMVGAYSDNQPDYSWLQPFETKSVQMFWYPFREIGGVKNANLDAAVNLLVLTNGAARLGFCTTTAYSAATATLKYRETVLCNETIAIDPAHPFVKEVAIPTGVAQAELRAELSVAGRELIRYSPPTQKLGGKGQWPAVSAGTNEMPRPVSDSLQPQNVQTVEELYLIGQRLEQFHDAGREPEPYWEEALRRDSGNSRVHTALGSRQLKQARYSEAEEHFRKAIQRLTSNYTAPKDGEPLYYLGLALAAQGKHDEALDVLFDATWSQAWRGPAYFSLAEIATRRGELAAALDYLDRSLTANALNVRALGLKASVLRHLGRKNEALAVVELAAAKTDPLDVRLMAERWLSGVPKADGQLAGTLRDHPATALETASEYGRAGLWSDGSAVLSLLTETKQGVTPMVYYYLGDFAEQLGDRSKAAAFRQLAAGLPPDYCFPFQSEAIPVLRRAIEANPTDSRAPYYLGNLLFDWQTQEAAKLWERAVALEPNFAIAHRNLALAYSHAKPVPDNDKAVHQLELAVAAPVKYALHFTELDELYARVGKPPAERLGLLERNHDTVRRRDDSLSREIGLKVVAGQYDQAIALMTGRRFSVWEGGRLDVTEHWIQAHLLRAEQKLLARDYTGTLADLEQATVVPENLPSDTGNASGHEIQVASLKAAAYEGLGQGDQARHLWEQAAKPSSAASRDRGRAVVERYYCAVAQQKLGQGQAAQAAFRELIDTPKWTEPNGGSEGRRPRQLAPGQREALSHFAAGLGHLGLGEWDQARAQFNEALRAEPDNPEVCASLKLLNQESK